MNQPVTQAFATKRKLEVRLSLTQQLETWDTNKTTYFLVSTWADSNSLNLYDWKLKTIALLCLITMARPRSDVGSL